MQGHKLIEAKEIDGWFGHQSEKQQRLQTHFGSKVPLSISLLPQCLIAILSMNIKFMAR
jgi:hypothetical protein